MTRRPRVVSSSESDASSRLRDVLVAAFFLRPLIGCDARSTTEDIADSPAPAATADATAGATVRARGHRELPTFDCASAIDAHLATRIGMNRCARDSDCGEIGPGLCPHGPYYVDRDGDPSDVLAEERRIRRNCKLPSCESPSELGIARCQDGVCTAGRTPASRPGKRCWDVRETHLEPNDEREGTTVTQIRGDTPRFVLAPIGSGTLRIAVDWPRDCDDCRLMVWRDEQGMQSPAKAVRAEDTSEHGAPVRREHFELEVSQALPTTIPDSTTNVVPIAATAVPYRLRTELLDQTGHPGAVSRHGTSWETRCEAVK